MTPRTSLLPALTVLLALPVGCTWVKLDKDAVGVVVVPADSVTDCQRVGSTTSTTRAKVGVYERGEDQVNEELVTLAKNSAASMGGNSLVAEAPPKDGKQTFTVYRCER